MRMVAESGKLGLLEVAELNPAHDVGGRDRSHRSPAGSTKRCVAWCERGSGSLSLTFLGVRVPVANLLGVSLSLTLRLLTV